MNRLLTERKLQQVLDRLQLVSIYDIRELTETNNTPAIVWRNLKFTVLVSYNDQAYHAAEKVLLFKRSCWIEGVEFPREIDMSKFYPPYEQYNLTSTISSKIIEGSKSKVGRINSIHLYLEGWDDRSGARQGELGCYDISSSERIIFRFWASRRRSPSNLPCKCI